MLGCSREQVNVVVPDFSDTTSPCLNPGGNHK
jgi:hypothetical protein